MPGCSGVQYILYTRIHVCITICVRACVSVICVFDCICECTAWLHFTDWFIVVPGEGR